jgi:deoxyguanosine kinase
MITFVMSARFISIIGPVAVGKTTLAEILSRLLPARLIREDYEGNPFLAGSFRGFEELALPSQLYFLFMRVKQLSVETFSGEDLVVTDYGFCQDRLYARIKLNDEEFQEYEKLRERITYLASTPSVVIHLDAPAEMLLHRIQSRGRNFEAAYDIDYLERLRRAHFDVSLPGGCKKIFINCQEVDLLAVESQNDIVEQIREALS